MKRWIIPLLVLPGTVLVVIPSIILRLTAGPHWASPGSATFWIGISFLLAGGCLAIGSMGVFFRHGEGTPAPWDPPRHLVVGGLYRHCRNPMITGVILLLIAVALLSRSWPIGIWAAVFFVGNAIYFPLVEEPGLRKRFGGDYRAYCENVGRWIPRLRSWRAAGEKPPKDD